MGKTREIKMRMKAVGNIRRITKTMQMIASGKFAKAQAAAVATKPYTEGIFSLVTELAATAGDITHPLINGSGKTSGKELTLIITSDRGLCGPYNSSVLRASMVHLRGAPAAKGGMIELVGKKGISFIRFNNLTVAKSHVIGDKPTFERIESLAQECMNSFIAGEVDAVRIIYMKYHSPARQSPEVLQLLPLKPPVAKKDTAAAGAKGTKLVYEFSPAAPELLGDLLPATVKATLYQCFLDAIVSEHVARMIAMKAATDAAGKMRKLYSRDYNRARQAQITTELSEIISGAAALG